MAGQHRSLHSRFIVSNLKRVALLGIVGLLATATLSAQSYCDQPYEPPVPDQIGVECAQTINYAPLVPEHTPIKTVRIALHSFQMDDGSGNFQNTPEDSAFMLGVVQAANSRLANLGLLNYGTTPYIQDARIRMEVVAFYFHPHTAYFDTSATVLYTRFVTNDEDGYGMTQFDKDNVEHILLKGSLGPESCCAGRASSSSGSQGWIFLARWYAHFLANGPNSSHWGIPGHLIHEFGHAIGNGHNFQNCFFCLQESPPSPAYQCDGCTDNDLDAVGTCPNAGTSWNYMDYPPNGYNANTPDPGFSACQLGRAHYRLDGGGTMERTVVLDHCTFDANETIAINGEHVWLGGKKLKGDLIIESGASLTIKCRVHMPNGAKIIVKPGGRLIIDEGLITNLCDQFWSGIQVWGDNTQHQWGATVNGTYRDFAHQGYVELRTGGTIENAREAIAMKNGGTYGTFGGVVRSYGGVFRNCRRSVEFLKYQNFYPGSNAPASNRSYFHNTTFTVDDDYRGGDDFHNHVSMWEVSGVNFSGCKFENAQTTISESHKLGFGIGTLDAKFTVKPRCIAPGPQPNPCPEIWQVPSEFIGLDHAIHATQSFLTTNTFHVENTDFTNNVCGIYSEGVLGFKVLENTFEVGDRDVVLSGDFDVAFNNAHRALYSTEGFGFLIDDNSFWKVGPSPSEGLVIGYSRGHNDMVFRNNAHNLDAAYVGEGICADENARAYIGLNFQCNDNANNNTNVWSRKVELDPDVEDQTIRTNQGRLERAADNGFDRVPENWDIRNTNNLSNVLTYWWQSPEAPNKPVYVTDGVIETDNYNNLPVIRPANNCTSRNVKLVAYPSTNPGPLVSGMQLQGTNYTNSAYLYKQLIDGGSTDEMVEEVVQSWPEEVWALRTSLLERSPYLTVKVLKEMVNKPSLPVAIKAEVCIANPDATKSEGFVKWLRFEAQTPMPESLINNIEASWDTKTFRTQLESTMAHHHGEMTQQAHLLMNYYQNDSIDHVDSLRWVWQQIRTPAARYAEALTYLHQGEFSAARSVIEDLPEEHNLRDKQESERYRMLALIDFFAPIYGGGRTNAQLSESEQSQLLALIADQRDRPATWAQNILCFHYKKCRAPLSGGEGGIPKALRVSNSGSEQMNTASLRMFPNPATNFVVFELDLAADPMRAAVLIQDIAGRVIKRLIVTTKEQQLVMDSREFAPGTYSVLLSNNGATLQTKNLIIRQ